MQRKRQRRVRTKLLAVALAGAIGNWSAHTCPAEAQTKPLPTLRFIIPNVEQTVAAATPPAARTPKAAPAQLAGDFWWNQPDYVEAFGLSEEQRKRMDEAMASTKERTEDAIRRQNEARDRFYEALKKRDWVAARRATEDWEKAFAAQWGVANQAKIAVLELLTPAQHDKLMREHAYLLDRPWTVGRRLQVQKGSAAPVTPTAGESR
ncbi:MAG: hypothetical protein KatS3mg077_3272 [Candidatus Binatia bacterium]|nr:MAG: hypothetical protein KatS3mg077_3272 [Candidatus Binatia bacterium]